MYSLAHSEPGCSIVDIVARMEHTFNVVVNSFAETDAAVRDGNVTVITCGTASVDPDVLIHRVGTFGCNVVVSILEVPGAAHRGPDVSG